MQIASRIEIVRTPNGQIMFKLEGQMSRVIFNSMIETVKQDAVEQFREKEKGDGTPKIVVPTIVPNGMQS